VQTEDSGRAVRGLTAQVARGKSVDENLNSLRSGVQNTRALAASVNTKLKTRGLANVAKDRSVAAKQYQTVVRNLSGSRASRTTSQSILNSLRGNRVTGTGPTGPTVSDVRRETERERRRIEMLVIMYVENIESAKRKAEEVRVKIMQ
jgi:hypothetical protein